MNDRWPVLLLATVLLYTLATTVHFIHNGLYLSQYPDMPAWISRTDVMLTLMVILGLGAAGCALYHYGLQRSGMILMACYAALGFDGLAHYGLASFSRHSPMMNFTILFEVVSAGLLVGALLVHVVGRIRGQSGVRAL